MKNVSQYDDDALSLEVFNDEYFYIERHNEPFLMALIAEEFIYTTAQLAVLKTDLADDLAELEGEE